MPNEPKPYPQWVCSDCGDKYGRGMPHGHLSCWHEDICGVCGEKKAVTEPRDFGYLKEGWDK